MSQFWYAQSWYKKAIGAYALRPLHWIVKWESRRRLKKLKKGDQYCPVPVIVVGNITVGGTGKTPVVICLVEYLQQQGLKVGVVSRGYGGNAPKYPLTVTQRTSAAHCGDEPKLIQQRTQAAVVVDPRRSEAVKRVIEQSAVDIIVSDDGLQHYSMPRTVEIVVVDAARGFGNQLCLPAGPLREEVSRLKSVDFMIATGGEPSESLQQLVAENTGNELTIDRLSSKIEYAVNLKNGQKEPLTRFIGQNVLAVAGIGAPDKFFQALLKHGIQARCKPLPDHHSFTAADIPGDQCILMTEKDAVKCKAWAHDNCWYIPLISQLTDEFLGRLLKSVNASS